MKPTKLCIIGNGFDLHHQIRTNYSDFSKHLRERNSEIYEAVERYLPVDKWWSNLEESFAFADPDDMVDYAMTFLQSYGSEDWRDSGHHDYQYELSNLIGRLSHKLLQEFIRWISDVEIPDKEDLEVQLLKLPRDSLYLSFNYTPTLQSIYSIPSKFIWHIHGSISDTESIVLGHGWNPIDIPDLNDQLDRESADSRIIEGYELLNDYFKDTFKPTEKIIEANIDKFEKLSEVRDVYVLGHSMADVDMPYFEKIMASVLRKAAWRVSYFGDDERESHATQLKGLNVQTYTLCKLGNIFDPE